MLFTTPEFFIFLTAVLIFIKIFRREHIQQAILLVASYFFYWYSGSIHVLLLAFVTLTSYYCGYMVFNSETIKKKKIWLIIGTLIPLAVLGYFKYIDFGIGSINSILAAIGITAQISLLNVALPVGISFFTFQALSYVFDIYLGRLEPEPKFHKYALFIAFFPQLVAGPIVRASEFLPQLKSKITITGENLQAGVTLIVWGLFKKMVIADNLAPFVDSAFADPMSFSSIILIMTVFAFGIQIYCDFSGYAHIAIGCARILGFKLPENFDMPYLASNIQLFWRKWHMTLSRFIKDYVYIPLGGNRCGHARTYLNLFASMALCGLWHGAAWTFVLWGAYHGLLLALHRYFIGEKKLFSESRFLKSGAGILLSILVTQILVFFGWLIFRANSFENLSVYVQAIFTSTSQFSPLIERAINSGIIDRAMIAGIIDLGIIAGIIGLVVLFILMMNKKFADTVHEILYLDYLGIISRQKIGYWIIYLVIFITMILFFSPPESPEFIYFAF